MTGAEERPPRVRLGEAELAGRRIAARALPGGDEAGGALFRFDPVERRILARSTGARASVGPDEPEAWRLAIRRAPAGSVLVGPSGETERSRLAFQAAVEGARRAGRGVYLLDPDPRDITGSPRDGVVAVFAGLIDGRARSGLEAASAAGIAAGVLFPIAPGWTTGDSRLDGAARAAADAGARFVAPIPLVNDGESRRRLVETVLALDPGADSAEELFHRVHHSAWEEESARASARLREIARDRGLASLPPRPAGAAEPRGNSQAAARLEELAERDPGDEHRFSLLRAAARWIDESGRDLRPIVAEGNFRKIFPFGGELAREAEDSLRTSPWS